MEDRFRWRRPQNRVSGDSTKTYPGSQCGEMGSKRYEGNDHMHQDGMRLMKFVGELLASAGDDGNVLLWVLSEATNITPAFGGDGFEEKEAWRTKHMCRSSGAEIYDLAWSPDSIYFIIGSMDNVARIYNAQTGMRENLDFPFGAC